MMNGQEDHDHDNQDSGGKEDDDNNKPLLSPSLTPSPSSTTTAAEAAAAASTSVSSSATSSSSTPTPLSSATSTTIDVSMILGPQWEAEYNKIKTRAEPILRRCEGEYARLKLRAEPAVAGLQIRAEPIVRAVGTKCAELKVRAQQVQTRAGPVLEHMKQRAEPMVQKVGGQVVKIKRNVDPVLVQIKVRSEPYLRPYQPQIQRVAGECAKLKAFLAALSGMKTPKQRRLARRLMIAAFIVFICCRQLSSNPSGNNNKKKGGSNNRRAVITSMEMGSQLWWQNHPVIPAWLHEYAAWHREQTASLTPENWRTKKYFVASRCRNQFKKDDQCGGTADRLAAMPLKLWYAAKWKRILFIDWDRPAPLEAFLLPPEDGLNWTVPSFMRPNMTYRDEDGFITTSGSPGSLYVITNAERAKNQTFVWTGAVFGPDKGVFEYNHKLKLKNETSYQPLYRLAWDMLFKPVPPIQRRIDDIMRENGLVENEYDAMHFRSQYLNDEAKMELIAPAADCTLTFERVMNQDRPIYVATDYQRATNMALRAFKDKTKRPASAMQSNGTLLHLDRGSRFRGKHRGEDGKYDPAAYYDTFVELYVLGNSRCIAFGRGSYGQWANLMSADSNCFLEFFDHKHRKYVFPCSRGQTWKMITKRNNQRQKETDRRKQQQQQQQRQ